MAFTNGNPLKQFLSTAKAALENDDGKEFAMIISLSHPSTQRQWNLSHVSLDPPFDQLLYEHFQCSDALLVNDILKAFNHQCNVIQIFAKMFKTQKEDNWGLPMMNVIIKDLYSLAVKADTVAVANGDMVGSKIDSCADMLMSVFRVCASDSRTSIEFTKRWGLMSIINLLFKCYFKTNKLHLCKPLILAIETNVANKDIKDKFSTADQVTYNYFVGMKHMFENEFKGAEKCLSFAFKNCLNTSVNNKRKILICLIPVKITLGFMPTVAVLKKYNLSEFEEIVEGVKKGDIGLFNRTLETHAQFFIKAGIYLILDKLKVITLRNLFKKIYHISGSFQIDIAKFQCALNWLGLTSVDSDETECILANMINDGYIKGYLSEQHKKIVVIGFETKFMSSEISKDLEILRLRDDIEQAGKEIKHLQNVIDNLVSDQSSHNESISRMSIENNALRLERDDLKGVIKLADDGIADLNTHWKEKFFTWRETEMQLLEEIEKLKEGSDELKEKYELKFKKQHLENTKLAALVEDCQEENCKLMVSLEKSEEELKLISNKLSGESRRNLQNLFISRENDLLTEKVKVLENKVDSFYEESIRQNSASVSVAEKDEKNRSPSTVNNYINQLKSLTEKLLAKEAEVKDLQEEMNRLSCINESQNCKLKQLRKLVTNANETIDKYSSEIRKEKEKLVSANSNVDGLNQKIFSLESTIKELKNEMQLKCGLLAEKDVKFEHFKSSFNDMKDSSEQLKAEITAYKNEFILLQDERNCLKEELNTLVAKYTSTKQISDEVSLQNKKLLEELECCNNKVTSINEKYQLSMVKNADVDDILEEYKQNIFNLEIALAENRLGLDALTEENALLKSDNKCLIENELLNKEVIANKNKCIDMLQDDIKSLDERNSKKIQGLEQHLTEKTTEFEEYKKFRGHERSVRDNKLHKELEWVSEKDESCMITDSHEVNSPKESKKLMEEIHRLEKDICCKDKKLSFAQAELSKQATEIVNHQCQIDRLTAKYTAMKQKLNKPANNLLTKDISNLNEKISALSEQLVATESELNELRISESNIKQREQSLCELSELVNILQQELDMKHTQISKEVEFYKSRLMEYEKRPSTVNKSINTSLPEEKSGDDSLSSKNGKDVDLQDLEIVMNNLKSTYQNDLNALHQSFKEKITQMDRGVDDGVSELQWINLMNT